MLYALIRKLRVDQRHLEDWQLLEALSVEISQNAEKQNLKKHDDIVRAVKDIRHKHLAAAKSSL